MSDIPHLTRCLILRVLATVAFCLALASCSETPRIQSDYVPAGSLRLAQVVQVATRREILSTAGLHEVLLTSGVSDPEIADGSVALARIYCCGGPDEEANARIIYIPASVRARGVGV